MAFLCYAFHLQRLLLTIVHFLNFSFSDILQQVQTLSNLSAKTLIYLICEWLCQVRESKVKETAKIKAKTKFQNSKLKRKKKYERRSREKTSERKINKRRNNGKCITIVLSQLNNNQIKHKKRNELMQKLWRHYFNLNEWMNYSSCNFSNMSILFLLPFFASGNEKPFWE